MPYLSSHTGQAIDEGISINATQNQRLTDTETKIITLQNEIDNLKQLIQDLQDINDSQSTQIQQQENKISTLTDNGRVAYGNTSGGHSVGSKFIEILPSSTTYNNQYISIENSRIKVKFAGTYRISLHARWSDPTSSINCYLGICQNGNPTDLGAYYGVWSTNTQRLCSNMVFTLYISPDTPISFAAYSNSSQTLGAISFTIEKIRTLI